MASRLQLCYSCSSDKTRYCAYLAFGGLRPWSILNNSEAQQLAAGALSFGFFSLLQFGSGRVYTETKQFAAQTYIWLEASRLRACAPPP